MYIFVYTYIKVVKISKGRKYTYRLFLNKLWINVYYYYVITVKKYSKFVRLSFLLKYKNRTLYNILILYSI